MDFLFHELDSGSSRALRFLGLSSDSAEALLAGASVFLGLASVSDAESESEPESEAEESESSESSEV